jgi:hypothetical protein
MNKCGGGVSPSTEEFRAPKNLSGNDNNAIRGEEKEFFPSNSAVEEKMLFQFKTK